MKSKLLLTLIASGLSLSAIAADKPFQANQDDAFITKGMRSIDLGQTINIDEDGYPEKSSFDTIYDEYDYQGAVSAYIQSIPQMTMYQIIKQKEYYGAKDHTDSLVMYRDQASNGQLTPNRAVTYFHNMANLAETGPMVYELPAGPIVGSIMDVQMRFVGDIGLISSFKGKAAKFLILTEEQELPADIDVSEYKIVRNPTNIVFFGFRVFNPAKNKDLEKQTKIYPLAERNEPTPNKFFSSKPDDKIYHMIAPAGMEYWTLLHEYIQQEKVIDEDRYMMARLQAVGIEKGKPFNPTARQQRILEKAALVGEKMAVTLSFVGRGKNDKALYRQDSSWRHPLMLNPSHEEGFITQLEERVDWTYEAYGISPAMKAKIPGKGSTYLGAYRDANNQWFDGGKNYKLHIEADAPAARFWDVSAYNLEKRGLLPSDNGKVSSINSSTTKDIKMNVDGSVDIFFGPGKAPKGFENNFITTVEGERWFTYFRLYGPTTTYFDRSWKMNDIVEVK